MICAYHVRMICAYHVRMICADYMCGGRPLRGLARGVGTRDVAEPEGDEHVLHRGLAVAIHVQVVHLIYMYTCTCIGLVAQRNVFTRR